MGNMITVMLTRVKYVKAFAGGCEIGPRSSRVRCVGLNSCQLGLVAVDQLPVRA
jgi:hypothetical protein